jgi:hypothetical protein
LFERQPAANGRPDIAASRTRSSSAEALIRLEKPRYSGQGRRTFRINPDARADA